MSGTVEMIARFAGVAMILYVIIFAMHIWCVVRVARSSQLLAAAVFFIPFFNYIALFKLWGDENSDIRKPMAYLHGATLLGWILVFSIATKQVDGLAVDWPLVGDQLLGRDQDADSSSAERQRYRELMAALKKEHGQIELTSVQASLAVPKHFRFISSAALESAGREFDLGLSADTLGWLVHERVDLGGSDAWWVELRWDGEGFAAEADFASTLPKDFLVDSQRASVRLSQRNAQEGFPQFSVMTHPAPPQWLAAEKIATWVEELAWEGASSRSVDCYALKQARAGVLAFAVFNQPLSRTELCLLAVRLGARSVKFAPAADVSARDAKRDKLSAYVLADYVTGRIGLDAD